MEREAWLPRARSRLVRRARRAGSGTIRGRGRGRRNDASCRFVDAAWKIEPGNCRMYFVQNSLFSSTTPGNRVMAYVKVVTDYIKAEISARVLLEGRASFAATMLDEAVRVKVGWFTK